MKTTAQDSQFAAALEATARKLLMNTAERKAAGPDQVALASAIVKGKKTAIVKDAVEAEAEREIDSGTIGAARREAEKFRNLARVRGLDTMEGKAATARAEAAERFVERSRAAIIAGRTAHVQERVRR